MFRRGLVLLPIVALWFGSQLRTAAQAVGEREPIPRLETGGPVSAVQALALSRDGKTLYEAGFDKVVRVWMSDPLSGKFSLAPRTFRIPLGPGFEGAINALALSPDDTWLAVGGLGAVRGRAGFQQIGVVGSALGMTDAMREDEGVIVLFHTQKQEQRRLRGHRGAVLALAFAPAAQGKPNVLASAAVELQKDGTELAVLRLWDCDRQEQLAQTNFRPRFRGRQELAAWHTGAGLREVAVAAVWGDDALRVWEATRSTPWEQPSPFAYAVALLPSVNRLVVATHGSTRGQLEIWSTLPGMPPQVDRGAIALPDGHYPLAVRPLTGAAGDRWGRAAVAVRAREQGDPCLVHLVDLRPATTVPLQATLPLWKQATRLPVLAAMPDGQLAAAGAADQAIRILTAAGGKVTVSHTLAGPGRFFPHVAFARKGNAQGLILGPDPRRQPGELPGILEERDLIFDLTQRSFVADRIEWKPDALAAAGWRTQVQIESVPRERLIHWTARLFSQDAPHGSGVRLENIRAVTDYALRPPDALIKVPLLAVSHLDRIGQPVLALYQAETGETLRHLTGHLGAIRGLAFSGDGRMLISSGEDRITCVWSLTSVPHHLDRYGALAGIAVREEAGRLRVAQVSARSSAAGKLTVGQSIEGFVEAGQLQRITTAAQFHDQLLLRRPGAILTVRLGDGGGDVPLRVGQATDEWKPLFTLFVSQAAQGRLEWIGWNPTGPYDVSDREAERFLGWHFNPAKPDAAAAFAAAAQYREQRYRRGILRHLLSAGNLSGALATWEKEDRKRKLPEANLRLWLNEDVGLDPRQADPQGRFAVARPATVNLIVDDLPLDHLGTAHWYVEGLTPEPVPFTEVGRRMLTADLTALKWERGTHRVRVVVRTNDEEPREVVKELLVRHQPEPPAKSVPLPPRLPGVVVDAPERVDLYDGYDSPEVTLTGRFVPGANQRPFSAVLLVNDRELQKIDAPTTWTVKFPLAPGTSRVHVRLRNPEGAEAHSETIQVRLLRTPRVLKVQGESESAKPLSGSLIAWVRSPLPLDTQAAEVEINGQSVGVTVLATRKEQDTWEVRFKEVPLREGANTVRLWPRNAEGRAREPAEWKVRHTSPPKPVLPPDLVVLEPARDVNWTARVLPLRFRVRSASPLRSLVLTREGRPPLRQTFDAGRLPPGTDLQVRFQLNPVAEVKSADSIDLARLEESDAGVRELTLPWVLLSGLNRFRLEATNEGGTQSVEWVVNYIYHPVRWSLTRLVPRGKGEPQQVPDDVAQPVHASEGRGFLEGHLTWDEDRSDLFSADSEVRVRVNGLKLSPVRLTAAQAKDRHLTFAVPVVLPRAKDNFLEVELAGIKVDGPRRRTVRVDCARPDKQPQRIHVLILRHGEPSSEDLRQRVTQALRPDSACELVLHGPHTGSVRRGQVLNELLQIKLQMDLRVRSGQINNVLVLLYEGAEVITPLGHFFPATVEATERELRNHALTCDSMAEYVAEMAGAQVLLLDVARTASLPVPQSEDRVLHWPASVRPGVLRYSLTAGQHSTGDRFLIRDLARVQGSNADLQGIVEGIAANFSDRLAEKASETPPSWFGGKARGYAPAQGVSLLYDWQLPASYTTLRVGREP